MTSISDRGLFGSHTQKLRSIGTRSVRKLRGSRQASILGFAIYQVRVQAQLRSLRPVCGGSGGLCPQLWIVENDHGTTPSDPAT